MPAWEHQKRTTLCQNCYWYLSVSSRDKFSQMGCVLIAGGRDQSVLLSFYWHSDKRTSLYDFELEFDYSFFLCQFVLSLASSHHFSTTAPAEAAVTASVSCQWLLCCVLVVGLAMKWQKCTFLALFLLVLVCLCMFVCLACVTIPLLRCGFELFILESRSISSGSTGFVTLTLAQALFDDAAINTAVKYVVWLPSPTTLTPLARWWI